MTHDVKVEFLKRMWNDAKLIYENDFYAFKHLPPYFNEPYLTCITIQYKVHFTYDDYFFRKGLVRTSLSTMNWSSPSLDVGAVPLDIWKAIFDLVCLKQP
jgi:hypothetical protein